VRKESLVIYHLTFVNCHLQTFGFLERAHRKKPKVFQMAIDKCQMINDQ